MLTVHNEINKVSNRTQMTLSSAVDKCTQFDVRISGVDCYDSQLQEESHLYQLLLHMVC